MTARRKIAEHTLSRGNAYPYDAPDNWRVRDDQEAVPPALDWAHSAARGVLADLNDRGGIKHAFNGIDEDTRADIVEMLAEVIRVAHGQVADPNERWMSRALAAEVLVARVRAAIKPGQG